MTPPLLSPSELQTILSRGEGQFVEFKSTWDRRAHAPPKPLWRRALRDKIADVVAAFANADGGLLLIGVDDDGTATGHGYADKDVDGLFAVPHRRLTPPVDLPHRTAHPRLPRDPRIRGPHSPRSRHDRWRWIPVPDRKSDRAGSHKRSSTSESRRIAASATSNDSGRKQHVDDLDLRLAESFLKETRQSEAVRFWKHWSTTASSRGMPATGE